MPHSNRALISMHESMLDGTCVDSMGLLFPLRLEIYIRVEGRRKGRIDLISIGEAWRFIDASMGIEADVYLDEDKLPRDAQVRQLYPCLDLSMTAINGDNFHRMVYKAEVRAIFLDKGSLWDRMPPIYWPAVPMVQYTTGTARAIDTIDVLEPAVAPTQREMELEPWFPWSES